MLGLMPANAGENSLPAIRFWVAFTEQAGSKASEFSEKLSDFDLFRI
jgi:hypothetical protein